MFNTLDDLAKDYDMCIFAGDFNTYDSHFETEHTKLSPVER